MTNQLIKNMIQENLMDGYEKLDLFNTGIINKLAEHYHEIIKLIGENPTREGLVKTPERVAKAIQFLTHGYDIDPEEIIHSAMFREDYKEMVIVKDIELYSLCEHHMLPFFGKAHVAYIPGDDGRITGLLGPNGAGKSTTMKLLTGYLSPSAGTARIAGHDVFNTPFYAKLRRVLDWCLAHRKLTMLATAGLFVLGVAAGLMRSDLKLPSGLIDVLSIYLLIAIGLKGGVELSHAASATLAWTIAAAVVMSLGTPLVADPVLRRIGGLARPDAASIAAHYGSVSVVTFAVGASYLTRLGVPFDGYLTVLLVFLEFPALMVGVLLAKGVSRDTPWHTLAHEVLAGKAIVLLVGALVIGWISGREGADALTDFYGGMFKGLLSLFLLAMGLITASRIGDLRQAGLFLIGFGISMPIVSACGGALVGLWLGLSPGSTTLLAVLYASASYIAAPAAMRIAIPEANPALSMGAALGVTFPFNVIIGIPLYHRIAQLAHEPPAWITGMLAFL